MKERIHNEMSLFEEEKSELCKKPFERCGIARVIECDNVIDIIEWSKCGKQRSVPCNFDDDYA